jgi:hypothetical protein
MSGPAPYRRRTGLPVKLDPKESREIPLHILPAIFATYVRDIGDKIYRISVVRTNHHYYNISVRTKLPRRELAPRCMVHAGPGELPGSGGRSAAEEARGGGSA